MSEPVKDADTTTGKEKTEKSETRQETKSVNVPFRVRFRRKVCKFCNGELKEITYKDVEILKRFTSERGKIFPRRMTGNCAKHQRKLARAIKQARIMALLPFVAE